MALISLTSVTLQSVLHVPGFWYHASRSYRACVASDGIMDTRVNAVKITYATMTLWRDPAAMRGFLTHPHHLKAMKWSRGRSLGKVYHYEHDRLPTWTEAEDLLERLGRVV